MRGDTFEYSRYRIDDIIARIESEIEAAERPRPEKVSEECVSIRKMLKPDSRSYGVWPYWDRFKTFEEADRYFTVCNSYEEVERRTEDGHRVLVVKDKFDDTFLDIRTYTWTHYPLEEDGTEPYLPDYSKETIEGMREAVRQIKKATLYVECVDGLLSGYDEISFHLHLKNGLKELEEEK